ncbi:caspase family protein [Bradyrhizobium jicamae]|uniref:caspase family protein n=1 Tax=Bradyrhizobium jicamae TaxID=280332 RepID=UPI001BA69B37|nr:caspase family protein [Bradyrhizobium jicamae]MBR0936627.1 caspase family protein [Bradyrhizobium jicamae]
MRNPLKVLSRRDSWRAKKAALVLTLFLTMHAGQAWAQDRIALVIGNSQYRKVNQLPNPVNDAADMTESLTRLGFTVKHLNDLDFDGFRRALIEFGKAARTADQAVIFFAGHGVEIDGKNWLIPIDAEVKSAVDVYAEAINLETLIDISITPKAIGLVILDACRTNPFASAKETRTAATPPNPKSKKSVISLVKSEDAARLPEAFGGLAPVEVTDNVLVAYAAAAGTIARDGRGRNSPYSGSLLRHIETPGLEVNYLFRLVHDDVLNETKYQEPSVYGTLSKEEIYLKQGDTSGVASADDDPDPEALAWQFVRVTNDVATLRRFSDQFPASPHGTEVRERVAQLESAENLAWTIVERQKSVSAYRAFLDLYPYGDRVDQARSTLASLQASAPSDQAETVELPRPPASKYHPNSASVSATRKNPVSVEKAWDVLKSSRDQRLLTDFSEMYPSLRSHRLPADSDFLLAPVNSTEWMLNTAQDEDVNQCFGGHSDACVKAIAKYPEYVQLTFQLCRTKGTNYSCMTRAIEEARKKGLLVSRFTRSELEKTRNKEYRRVASRVQDNVQNIVSNVVSNAVSTSVSNSVSAAVGRAASTAASAAASNAASRAASAAASHAAGKAASLAASNAAGRAASTAASNAAGRAASTAASHAAGRAASTAASNAAGRAATTAASNAAGRAASTAASTAAAKAASNAASKAAAEAAAQAAANAASNIRVPSDFRLKRDIVPLDVVHNGLQLYRYRYVGDSTYYVGVMAQDVAKRVPAAIDRGPHGYLRVDYGMLGLKLLTFTEWTKIRATEAAHILSTSSEYHDGELSNAAGPSNQ